jgi:hypothetical protein
MWGKGAWTLELKKGDWTGITELGLSKFWNPRMKSSE